MKAASLLSAPQLEARLSILLERQADLERLLMATGRGGERAPDIIRKLDPLSIAFVECRVALAECRAEQQRHQNYRQRHGVNLTMPRSSAT